MTTMQSREIEAREKSELTTEGVRPEPVFRPDVDILEQSDAFVIHADMPGANEDTVDIRLDNGVLTLEGRLVSEAVEASPTDDVQVASGERPVGDAPETKAPATPVVRHAEYRLGSYRREFRLSKDIDVSAVSARMRDGVLELRLPKAAELQPRRIAVEAA
ncbi:MAG: Hsp20/alpha crystallin family protein [Myxococcota bacterium]